MQLYCLATHNEIQSGTHPHFPWKIHKKTWTNRKRTDFILCLSEEKKISFLKTIRSVRQAEIPKK